MRRMASLVLRWGMMAEVGSMMMIQTDSYNWDDICPAQISLCKCSVVYSKLIIFCTAIFGCSANLTWTLGSSLAVCRGRYISCPLAHRDLASCMHGSISCTCKASVLLAPARLLYGKACSAQPVGLLHHSVLTVVAGADSLSAHLRRAKLEPASRLADRSIRPDAARAG